MRVDPRMLASLWPWITPAVANIVAAVIAGAFAVYGWCVTSRIEKQRSELAHKIETHRAELTEAAAARKAGRDEALEALKKEWAKDLEAVKANWAAKLDAQREGATRNIEEAKAQWNMEIEAVRARYSAEKVQLEAQNRLRLEVRLRLHALSVQGFEKTFDGFATLGMAMRVAIREAAAKRPSQEQVEAASNALMETRAACFNSPPSFYERALVVLRKYGEIGPRARAGLSPEVARELLEEVQALEDEIMSISRAWREAVWRTGELSIQEMESA